MPSEFEECSTELVHLAASDTACDGRKGRRSHRHAEQTQRELHEAKRVAQPTHRAVQAAQRIVDAGGEIGVHHHVDLDRGVTQDRGNHQAQDALEAGVGPIDGKAKPEPQAMQRR